MQLGHAGAKGSTRVPWEGDDQPLDDGNWPLISASPQQYLDGVSDWSRAMTRADMDRVRDDFVRARALRRRGRLRLAGAALRARLPAVELHLAADQPAHRRVRRLAGEPAALSARSVPRRCARCGPQDLPMSVRISAHDWVEGGITPDDAVEIARAFKAAGADMIDCSSGQVSKKQKPVYGRMYQTPFADRIRNEAGIADHRGGRDLRGRPRQQHHRRRPRRPVRGGAAAPGQPGLDAASRRPRSASPTSTGRSSTARPRCSSSATSSARRAAAAQAPACRR